MAAKRIPERFLALRVHVQDESPKKSDKAAEAIAPLSGAELRLETVSSRVLPARGVDVCVQYSSLNYKDALSASGNRGVSRLFPHTPGIDAAGYRMDTGEPVVVIGFDLGMNTPGGLAQFCRVPEEWLVPLPPQLDAWSVMAIGTAGITALLALSKFLALGLSSAGLPLVVNAAGGGVGSLATLFFSRMGFRVHAQTGRASAVALLQQLGASSVGSADELLEVRRALPEPKFAGGLDSLGGHYTAALLKHIDFAGALAICGNIAGNALELASFPLILRGVSLLGLASADTDAATKAGLLGVLVEQKLAPPEALALLTKTISLEQVPAHLEAMLAGQSAGRVVVKVPESDIV